jgi:hypothetical protein
MSQIRIPGVIASTMRYLASAHHLCYVSAREAPRLRIYLFAAGSAAVPEAL